MPEISVIMGVLCQKEKLSLLRRSVQSILNQSFNDFEFIICVDGSDNEIITYLNKVQTQDNRVQVICENKFYTLSEKLNACLRQARGKFIARMDDDDFSFSQRFREQIYYLKKNPDIAFIGCNVRLLQNGEIKKTRDFPEFPTVKDFYFAQPFIHPSLMFRREVLETLNGYSERPHCFLCEDYDLLLRLYAKEYRGANLQEYLFDYTVPLTAKGSRKMSHRWNESVTRFYRFRELKVLPHALPYIFKPLLVGLLPECLLRKIKEIKL